ncbi:MAG: hypothetical protein H5T65_12020 [Chloroflexi bacterium]|nr:hypothetical protein [Chloroflexota bacterium]
MSIVITLLKAYAIWLYILFAIVALFALRAALKARAEIRQSIFSLEKEFARNRLYRAVTVMIVMALLAGALFVATHLGGPTTPATTEPTPTATRFLRATPTYSPEELTPTPTATITRVRPTRQPIPTAPVFTPTATPAPPPLCPTPGVNLTSPRPGARLSGVVQVTGTAAIGNFWYYKIEIGIGSNPSQWSVVGDLHYAPVSDGVLETFNAAAFPAGEYTLRLVVVDKTGNFPEPCAVAVTIAP